MYRAILLQDIKASANKTVLRKAGNLRDDTTAAVAFFGAGLLTLPLSHTIDLKHLSAQPFNQVPMTKHFIGVTLYRIGMAYKEGIGTKAKPKKAIKFLEKAVEFGNEEAMKPLESLRSRR
ncbi:SEL1-like repeat protein [Helicobacter suis]|uniref:SEL1-like repeat protein n=1 Tax=Helicobacter suis TaxID=104628 RepID=UPI0013D15D55|nr:SEL1-like repeat protein [Helicobacter suis]